MFSMPDNPMLVTADMVGLFCCIPHSAGFNSLKKAFKNRVNKQVPTNYLVEMAEFVFSNNYFEFSEKCFSKYHEQL